MFGYQAESRSNEARVCVCVCVFSPDGDADRRKKARNPRVLSQRLYFEESQDKTCMVVRVLDIIDFLLAELHESMDEEKTAADVRRCRAMMASRWIVPVSAFNGR
jgi:alkanesulfonate monooxygenase SsuD/methylene tetrahydromethanopterin reductase-like flavin-dependent oxidoreductase (luciferase family)